MSILLRRLFTVFLPCLLALLWLSIGGCGRQKQQQGIPQSDWEKLIAIRTEAKQAFSLLASTRFNAVYLGQSPPDSLKYDADQYRSLFSVENVRLLQRIEDSYQPSPEERQVKLLRQYLTTTMVVVAQTEDSNYIRDWEPQRPFANDGDTLDNERISRVLATESDRDRRRRILDAVLPLVLKQNVVLATSRVREDSVLLELGYGDMTSYLQEVRECDLAMLSQVAEKFIEDTDSLTRTLFVEVAPKITGVRAEAFRSYDLPYLSNGAVFDRLFPAKGMIDKLKLSLIGMGIDLDSLKGIKTSKLDPKGGRARPATFAVQIPTDIRLPIWLEAGQGSYHTLYHEVGHALRLAHITERDFEFAYLGNNTLDEASAFMIEQLLDQPDYLRNQLGVPVAKVKEFLRYRALMNLISIRSLCGDLLYEQVLYSGDNAGAKNAYERIKQPLLGYPWSDVDREGYLSSADYLYSADYLRGWFLAAQIQEKLRSFAGEDYWTKPATGEFLKKVWASGNRYTPEEVARSLGIDAITPDALLRQIESMLQ